MTTVRYAILYILFIAVGAALSYGVWLVIPEQNAAMVGAIVIVAWIALGFWLIARHDSKR